MSDFDDDLLALAEGTSAKRVKKTKKAKRKREEAISSASDMDMSGDSDAAPSRNRSKRAPAFQAAAADESDEEALEADNPYPLEGCYKDEADRRRILAMTELEREAILSERAEEVQQKQSRLELRRMVQAKEDAEQARKGGAKSTGRERKTTGASKEKAEGMERLRRSRQEKGQRAQAKKDLSSDDDGEDEPDQRRTRNGRKSRSAAYSDSDDDYQEKEESAAVEAAGPTQMREITLTRSRLVPFLMAPWFEDWSKGAWVRLGLGMGKSGQVEYRLCKIDGVSNVPQKPYTVEGTRTTMQLLLRHGSAAKYWTLDSISNQPPTEKEYARLVKQLQVDKMPMPSAKEATALKNRLDSRTEYVMTEADLAAALARRGPRGNSAQTRAKLLMDRDFARSAGDAAKVAEIEKLIAELDAPAADSSRKNEENDAERLRRVNERNRAQNREEVAKAEARYQEERRRQAAALARGDLTVKVDPSARVKTMTRLKYDRETPNSSRQGTPGPSASKEASQSTTPTSAARTSKFDQSIVKSVDVEIDLDF